MGIRDKQSDCRTNNSTTGLIDPEVEIRPIPGQIDDLNPRNQIALRLEMKEFWLPL